MGASASTREMDGDVGVDLDGRRKDPHDPVEHPLAPRRRQLQVSRDGGEVTDVVPGAQGETPLDHALPDIGEPLGCPKFRARPLHGLSDGGAVGRRNVVGVQERRPSHADGLLHLRVGRPGRSTETGENPARLEQRGHPGPAPPGLCPVQRRRRVDQPVALAERQVLEGRPYGPHVCRHVSAQLREHGRVRFGGGDRDARSREQTGGLTRSGTDLEGGPDRAAGIGRHHVEQLGGISGPEPFVRLRDGTETQGTTGHGDHRARSGPRARALFEPPCGPGSRCLRLSAVRARTRGKAGTYGPGLSDSDDQRLATSACLARTASAASLRPASSDSVSLSSTTFLMPSAPIWASTPR